jgi:hypothetical protein
MATEDPFFFEYASRTGYIGLMISNPKNIVSYMDFSLQNRLGNEANPCICDFYSDYIPKS